MQRREMQKLKEGKGVVRVMAAGVHGKGELGKHTHSSVAPAGPFATGWVLEINWFPCKDDHSPKSRWIAGDLAPREMVKRARVRVLSC